MISEVLCTLGEKERAYLQLVRSLRLYLLIVFLLLDGEAQLEGRGIA